MIEPTSLLPFDIAAALKHLSDRDERLKSLIEETLEFSTGHRRSQFSVRRAARIHRAPIHFRQSRRHYFRTRKALGSNGNAPTPHEMLRIRKPALRKAGLSGAKILAMKDLAKKTLEGVVPTLEQAQEMSDEELITRLVSVRGIGAWKRGNVFDFSPRPPGRSPRSRSRREKRLVRHLREKVTCPARKSF